MNSNLHETEAFFHEQIPITRAMGVRVSEWDGRRLVLEAPLAANHNHLGTAFGGSLASLATLAAYGLVWLELRDPTFHVVVRQSSIQYLRPVRQVLRAVCQRPEDAVVTAFREALAAKGKARIELRVTIEDDGQVAAEFTGTFVAVK